MNIEEIAKRIAELHYPNKPNAIIDESYREVRMETLRKQVESELKNCSIPDVVGQSEQLVCPDCKDGRDPFDHDWLCPECRQKEKAN